MWDLLQVAGLIDERADRALAAEAWAETTKGQCCPLFVVDTHDRAMNELILVHELTHALDWPYVRHPSDREIVAPERAIVEGNAHRVAYAYVDELVESTIPPPPAIFASQDDPRMPPALREIFEYPYEEAKVFAETIAAQEGEEVIVRALNRPPLAVEVLHPQLWLDNVERATVEVPKHLVVETTSRSGNVGAFFLKLMLQEHISGDDAHQLAWSWKGDSYAFTQSPQRRCLGITFVVDNSADAETIAQHLEAVPSATVAANGDHVEFSRCLNARA